MRKVNWGIISTANIAVQKVIPAMQKGSLCHIKGIASRDLSRAQRAAEALHIETSYGSYEEMLNDPEIEAVYNPLPNHLHVPVTLQALQAGKHVLCEKPIALSTAEAKQLQVKAQKHPQLKVMEAFMYRFHPQWQKARELVRDQKIGELRTIQSFFSYYNVDPENVRNKADIGGGGLMDIGCYPISLSRFIFDTEPKRVLGQLELDPDLKIDRLASAVMDFGDGTSTFTCATQLSPYQRVNIFGTEGRIEIEIPFNAPPDKHTRIWHRIGDETHEIVFDVCDQYTIQGDHFSSAILEDTPVPTPLEDAVENMRVLEAIAASSEKGNWVSLTQQEAI